MTGQPDAPMVQVPALRPGQRSSMAHPIEDPPLVTGGSAWGFVEILLRRKFQVLGVCIPFILCGIIYVFIASPKYTSEASLIVDFERGDTLKSLGEAWSPAWWVSDYTIRTQKDLLKSRALAAAVVDKLHLEDSSAPASTDARRPTAVNSSWIPAWLPGIGDQGTSLRSRVLDPNVEAPSGSAGNSPQPSVQPNTALQPSEEDRRRRGRIAARIRQGLTVKHTQGSRILDLTFTERDPYLARQILDTYIEIFLSESVKRRREPSQTLIPWIRTELEAAQRKLKEKQQALVAFSEAHGLVTLDDSHNHVLSGFNSAAQGLTRAREKRYQLEAFARTGRLFDQAVLPPDIKGFSAQSLKDKLILMEVERDRLASVYRKSFPRVAGLDQDISYLRKAIGEKESQMASAALETARVEEKILASSFEDAKNEAMKIKSLGVQFLVLKKEMESAEGIHKLLLEKSKEIEINDQISLSNVSVVDAPSLSLDPRSNKSLVFLICVSLGLAIGCATGIGLETISRRVSAYRSPATGELRVLGGIPKAKPKTRSEGSMPPWERHLTGEISESFQNVLTSVKWTLPEGLSHGRILVTSPNPLEGKSFVAARLARAVAERGQRAVIVNADLRKIESEAFRTGDTRCAGLIDLLSDSEPVTKYAVTCTSSPNLCYVPCGKVQAPVLALYDSPRLERVLHALEQCFDLVVLDTPPLLHFSDAAILSRCVHGVVLVVKEGTTPEQDLTNAKLLLRAAGVPLLGVVFNMVPKKRFLGRFSYNYHGSYRYPLDWDRYGSRYKT